MSSDSPPTGQPAGAPLTVVAAVLRRADGCILLAQRHPGGPHGGLWEFPGGKVEPGESLTQALARELREELGLEVAVGRALLSVEHHYPHIAIRMTAFECRVTGGELRCLDCQNARWVPTAELLAFPMPQADEPIASALLRWPPAAVAPAR